MGKSGIKFVGTRKELGNCWEELVEAIGEIGNDLVGKKLGRKWLMGMGSS